MAMIKIVKGELELTIPAGAFKSYALAGWSKEENPDIHDDKGKKPHTPAKQQDLEENPEQEDEPEEETPEETPEEPEGDEEEVEYVDPEELLQRPLGELDFEELQIVAEYLGIDTKPLTSSKKLRAAIKEAQK